MNHRLTRSSTVLAAALLVLGGAAIPAGAGEPTCDPAFDALRDATIAAEFTSTRDEDGLLAKVDAAKAKFQSNKVAGSLQKLTDYANKVSSLTAQGKVVDAAGMVAAHAVAVSCVTAQ